MNDSARTTTAADETAPDAAASGEFSIGGDLAVPRLGYGSMQLTGDGVWGQPEDRDAALGVLRRAVELGVGLIDTADSYGPDVAEGLIHDALHPYDESVVIATKAGLLRTGPGEWHPLGRPEYLRQQAEMSLRRLDVERIDLFQLHRIDPSVPMEDQIGTLSELRDEGKIRNIGLSEVSADELRRASEMAPISTVQNRYNLLDRASADVLAVAESSGVGFIPWFPVATGQLAESGGPLAEISERTGATPAQLALAWLLAHSPVMLPIPGTSSLEHLEENVGAAGLELSDADVEELDSVS